MNKILNETTGVNNSYLDKVVNLEIEMPRDFNRQKCKLWLQNLLLTYKIPAKNINSYDFILDFIVNNINDIRELKRVINSTFAIMAISKTLRLNLPQVLA
ncbi:P-loop NTPase fold protein, partial [Lactobacillus helveticus]